MRQYYQSLLERKKEFDSRFETEPYEAAWASEAIFYIKVEGVSGDNAKLDAKVQISPAGHDWVDDGTKFPSITKKGVYFVKVKHFGGWLRLDCNITGKDARFLLTIHIILKE